MKKSKYPLTTQTGKIFLVIRKNKKIPLSVIKAYCEEYYSTYAFIEHEGDIEPITKEVEGTHYHIIGDLKNASSRPRLSTTLNDVVKYFRFDNANGLEIDKYDNFVNGIQYLIHKNQPEKTQHKASEIITNLDKASFNLYITTETNDIVSFDMVYSTCYSSNNIIEVIKELGIKNYHKYRNTIKDIYDFTRIKKARERSEGVIFDIKEFTDY